MATETGREQAPLGWPAYVLAFAAFAVLIALGTWQMQRLGWKEELLATIEARRTAAPLDLGDVEKRFVDTHDVDYQAVHAAGDFLHDREQYFFATWKGDAGFYVYTPLRLADGRFVFVNRGFVPYELKERAKRPPEAQGVASVTGLARNPLAGKPSFMVPDNDPGGKIFYWKDLGAMAKNAGLDPSSFVPFFIDADSSPNPGGLPQGGVTLIDLPNNHLQYALTWYGLAAALVAVFGSFAWRRARSDKA